MLLREGNDDQIDWITPLAPCRGRARRRAHCHRGGGQHAGRTRPSTPNGWPAPSARASRSGASTSGARARASSARSSPSSPRTGPPRRRTCPWGSTRTSSTGPGSSTTPTPSRTGRLSGPGITELGDVAGRAEDDPGRERRHRSHARRGGEDLDPLRRQGELPGRRDLHRAGGDRRSTASSASRIRRRTRAGG